MKFNQSKHLFAVIAVTTAITVATAQAGLVFTVEAPGVQASTVAGVITEDFNDGNLISAIGTYSGSAAVIPADVFGGAGRVGSYMHPSSTLDAVLTLTAPQTYFGLWWSAGNVPNTLKFYDPSDVLLGSYAVGDIIPFLSPGYYGNPNPPGGNPAEPYVYLNYTATGTDFIKKVVFGGGTTFESDNHSITDRRIDPPGTRLPDSGSTLALSGLAVLGLLSLNRFLARKSGTI